MRLSPGRNGKRTVLVCVLLLLLGMAGGCGPAGPEEVTFQQLFTSPGGYNGKVIILEGFYFSGFEIQVISESLGPSGNAAEHLVPGGRMVWVDGGIPIEVFDRLYRQQQMGPEERFGKVRIEGTFEYGGEYGHLGAYDSQIKPASVELLSWSPPVYHSEPELKYLVLDDFEEVFWCDPDFYPVGRPGGEEQSALEQFPAIRDNETEFSAILKRLGLPEKTGYSDEEKLLIYREHKKLAYQVELAPSGDDYRFTLRVKEGQGERIEGTVAPAGDITVTAREPSFNTCPICLTEDTMIDTPDGPVPVQGMREGMPVWTFDNEGRKVAGTVLRTAQTGAPSPFKAVKITLSDGRSVIASPRHPTAEARLLGSYAVGEILDGAVVTAAEDVAYDGFTYDLLPSGDTGLYLTNGILLKSTLTANQVP